MSEWESIIGSNRVSSYGTCAHSMNQSTNQYIKHYLDKSDTLQGLSVKYNSSTDEIRRINKLYSTDSIFLREYLLVPASKTIPVSDPKICNLPQSNKSPASPEREMDTLSFLQQLDASVSARKNALKDYKFVTDLNYSNDTTETSAKLLKSKDFLKPEQTSVRTSKETFSNSHHYDI